MADQVLTLKWTISRARDTYGYNVVTLTDEQTGHKCRASGGGYDMTGTVLGEWLASTYYPALLDIASRAHSQYVLDGEKYTRLANNEAPDSLYGMTATTHAHGGATTVRLDGACGLQSIERIAEAIGLKVRHITNRHGDVTMFVVES